MNFKKLLGTSVCLSLISAVALAAPPPLTTVTTNSDGQKMVADSMGKTLYVFDPDMNQPTPTCTGDCAEVWPPYLLTPDEANAVKNPLGKVERANKKMQLTYGGRPVYTYALDRAQGNDAGDGLEGTWHIIKVTTHY
ncbi:hypothetical protein [Bdellovibrio sp. HCB2-146]|uniref:COG4315 family predicted lipoprotein n=1 Tax=Bdellovibrio sp. HCB2-146 TaxID=3394362 RepID=UPI0039BD3BB0